MAVQLFKDSKRPKSCPSLFVMENVENTTLQTGNQGDRASEPHNSNSRPNRGRRLPQSKKEQPPADGSASNRRNRYPKSEPSNAANAPSGEGRTSSFVSVFFSE